MTAGFVSPPPIIVKPIDSQCTDCCRSIYAACLCPPPPTVLVHDDDGNVGICLNSDAIVPQLQSPMVAVIIAINVIHLPSTRSCPSISLRLCGMALHRHDDVTANWGCCCH
jgi:hypothetical protein